MPALFEASTLKNVRLRNRFVRSATYEALAGTDGRVTEELAAFMAELSKGEVGLVISGHAHVLPEGQAGPHQMGAFSDALVPGLSLAAKATHEHGAAAALQLAHAGVHGIGKGPHAPLGPSDGQGRAEQRAKAMTREDISRTVTAFGDAASRAQKAGFDAVQIHAAHGYLLSQFLSPFYNKRNDEYGGSLENRARMLMEVYREVRQRVGHDYPVLVKMNCEDFLEGGLTFPDMLRAARLLKNEGLDGLEMSGGTFQSGKKTPSRPGKMKEMDKEVYYKEAAKAFKKELRIPLILVGGFLSFESAERAVQNGLADYVALSRPLIREPHLIKRWANGDRHKATCVSCNSCFKTFTSPQRLHCPKLKEKSDTGCPNSSSRSV